jgi:hypothetical protein
LHYSYLTNIETIVNVDQLKILIIYIIFSVDYIEISLTKRFLMTIAYGLSGFVKVAPAAISQFGPPAASFKGLLGQSYFDTSTTPPTEYVFNGSTWTTGGSPLATNTTPGSVFLGTLSQLENGTAPNASYVPSTNDVYTFIQSIVVGAIPPATTVTQGIVFLATNAQAVAGVISTNTVIVPANLPAVFASPPAIGGTVSAAGTFTSLTSVGTTSLNATGSAATTIGGSSGAITVAVGAGNFSLTGGGNTVGIANDAAANLVTIGSLTGAASLALQTGTGNFTLNGVGATTYNIGAATTTGTTIIGGTAQTGTITLGSSSGTNIWLSEQELARLQLI